MTKITSGMLAQMDPAFVAHWNRVRASPTRLRFPPARPIIVIEATDDAEADVQLFRLRRRNALDAYLNALDAYLAAKAKYENDAAE